MKVLPCSNLMPYARRFLSTSALKHFESTASQRRSASEDDYQVMHRSSVPTMHFQKSLLRLPIPDLEKTCSRYLRSQEALLPPTQYEETQKIVQDFGNNVGKELQEQLKAIDKANRHTSYISGPWFDMYLCDRAPIVLNYNPFLTFLMEDRPGFDDPVIRASNVLVSSMRFLNTLKQSILEPEVYHLNPAKSDTPFFRKVVKWTPSAISAYAAYAFKAFPLDMSQFKNLFHSTRIPQQGKDAIREFPEAKHMLIMKRGNFYVFDLFDADGNLFPPSHVHACISYIYGDQTPAPEFPVGVLTAQDRDVWAEMRRHLLQAGNKEALRLIDSAAFNLSFDDEVRVGSDPKACYRTFLYGDAANRWFDKSFSLIFTADGVAALNFEHAWGDGVAVMRYFNEVAKELRDSPWIDPGATPAPIDASRFVRRLDFTIPPVVKTAITDGLASYQERTEALGVDVYESSVMGKDFCKKHKVSPDAVMQLGFQLAYYLQNRATVATYESCSTSAFKHGRTETLRPATLETTAFSKAASAMLEGKAGDAWASLKPALHDCSAMHGKLTKEAAMGQGFDRHLFGLRKMAEAKGGPLPALFTDPSYAKMNHNILSTSTLPSNLISFGGFAPVVRDGFGVGYQIQDSRLGIVLSSYPPHRNGPEFLECADKAYQTIHRILSHA